jgi:hypothetical protein
MPAVQSASTERATPQVVDYTLLIDCDNVAMRGGYETGWVGGYEIWERHDIS